MTEGRGAGVPASPDPLRPAPADGRTAHPAAFSLGVFGLTLAAGLLLQTEGARAVLGGHAGLLFAAIWLYVPLLAMGATGLDRDGCGLTWAQARGSASRFAVAVALLVPYTTLAWVWRTQVQGLAWSPGVPASLPSRTLEQFVLVALPEEVFFRGYLQPSLDRVARPWRVFGVQVGPGLLLANALFAIAHLVLLGDPRTLSVFVPGLLFGYLRQYSGSVAYPCVYHALCNLYQMSVLG
ncbi:MAG: CPBP family intramembrane metalloprotease [Candidatus Riflebacteria bacterium]|nr:CPBP family intramembrane metalloprotease [Candidatus Riflebacteria bacterium]